MNYVFFKKNLMVYSEIFHNDDTFHAYNETIVNIIITSVYISAPIDITTP